jgi:hypothetical protein
MLPTNGIPDPTKVENFATNIGPAVDVRTGPGGDLSGHRLPAGTALTSAPLD